MTDQEEYHLSLVMTQDYNTLEKDQLVDLVGYLLESNYKYYLKEVDEFFGEDK